MNHNIHNNQLQRRPSSVPLGDITQQQANGLPGKRTAPTSANNSATTTPTMTPLSFPTANMQRMFDVDPCTVPEYSDEIIKHLMRREAAVPRDGSYLETQRDVTERMRQILVDWLIDVNLKFKLHPETFFLAVDIVDRYLSKAQVARAQLQLVGITAVLIAAKHEEVWPPEVKDCVYIAANTYTAAEVLVMERDIAGTLFFRFTVPTPYPIIVRLLEATGAPESVRHAAMFFLESAAHEIRLVPCLPSRVACASLLLARLLIATNSISRAGDDEISLEDQWDSDVEVLSHGVTLGEIEPIARQLLQSSQALTNPSSRLQAVRRKYLSQRYGGIAGMTFPVLPNDFALTE
jgi:cyclin-A